MSDVLYSSARKSNSELAHHITGIYQQNPPNVAEFHGDWGSLAVSDSLYQGFQPLETDDFIFIVIGGPVLCWQSNAFLTGKDAVAGTRAIFDRWRDGKVQWDEDLSGPFVVVAVNKHAKKLHVITDLLMFIPVYEYKHNGELLLGTHVDAVAEAAGQTHDLDLISIADFVLNAAVTYPYSAYTQIRQGSPASDCIYEKIADKMTQCQQVTYWQPVENNDFDSINQAANAITEGLHDYIDRVTESMTEVAQFISGGEDTRAISGLLPVNLNRDAYTFLDDMNREGRIGRRVAQAYGANFHAEFRGLTHYLDILPEAADLVGRGHPCRHAHTLRFHEKCNLREYPAVFGGYLSDSFLKGLYSNKPKIVDRFAFIPEYLSAGESRSLKLKHACFDDAVLAKITQRRRDHLDLIKKIRPDSAHEWFALYPATMMITIPNVYANRRLFRSYEPFMCKQVVKIGAAVPIGWKLNRRLFNKVTKPIFRKTRWVSHTGGHLPYYPWWVNVPIQFANWFWLSVGKRIGLIEGTQGPWADWRKVMQSPEWKNSIEAYKEGFEVLQPALKTKKPEALLLSNDLTYSQRINLMQTLYNLKTAKQT
jgi:hypothetical protein